MIKQLGERNSNGQTPVMLAVHMGSLPILSTMLSRSEWVAACRLNAKDKSEAHFNAMDLAVKPPTRLDMLACLISSGASPTPRVVLTVARNRKISQQDMEDCSQTSEARQRLTALSHAVDQVLLTVLRRLPQTVSGFHTFFDGSGESQGIEPAGGKGDKGGILGGKGSSDSSKRSRQKVCSSGMLGCSGENCATRRCAARKRNLRAMAAVQEILEPELTNLRPRDFVGPLALALEIRHLDFLNTSLVTDYLFLKFSAGLPNPLGDASWRQGYRHRRFMLNQDESKLRVYLLQGGCSDSPQWTYLPGLQFILAGLAGHTAAFYKVPAMRLAIDIVAFLGVTALFSVTVVVQGDFGTLGPFEFCWGIYIFGAVWTEIHEYQGAGSLKVHLNNPWNFLDFVMLGILLLAFLLRSFVFLCIHSSVVGWECSYATSIEEQIGMWNVVFWAKYLHALSAPLVFGRTLFVTNMHSVWGPLVHATFQMMGNLLRFGMIMVIILLGFAVSFHGLFGENVYSYSTFRGTCLTLFSSMLGDFDFQVFEGEVYGSAGSCLLVLYLCVMSIMLFNLLIAVLSTSHATVVENSENESSLSTAVLITHYR
ncbi:unnamed protein product [Choristocarpus tenellus]